VQSVVPFRAWRYDSAAGELSRLVAPPYDVIGPESQSRLYAASRHNVVRVDLGMTTPSDSECDNQYTRAASQLAAWKREGILQRDPEPSLTFVEESFTGPDGRASVRHGFLAAMRLHEFDQGVVFPHEWTLSGPKEDRFRLMTAAAMSLSPVFLLYDLPGDDITAAWASRLGPEPPTATVAGGEGTVTKLWATSDPELLEVVRGSLESSRFVIADGHHRYETALRYQKTQGTSAQERPRAFDYALAYFSNMADSGLAIYGTHRLVAGLDPRTLATLPHLLAGTFAVERLTASTPSPPGDRPETTAEAAESARTAITGYLTDHPRFAFGLWGPGFDAAYGLRLIDPAAARAAAPGHIAAYQELDVTILQTLVFEKALGITAADMAAERYVTYFKDPNEALARLRAGEFQAGFFMNPTGLDQVRECAFAGERMPQKATFFYPKLPTGLVFYDLTGE
jgi:uncharacterized protein (DUF1015 family)